MSCPCLQSNPIPTCIELLSIGTIDNVNTAVVVFITNISTGRVDTFETTSDGAGLVEIDVSDFEINDGTNYKVEVYVDLMDEAETITVTDSSGTCVYFTGEKLNGIIVTDAHLSTLNNSTSPSGSGVRYKQTATDYTHTSNIYIIGITDTTSVRTITLCDPADFPTGQILTIKDESGTASLNPPVIAGDIEGLSSINIVSDFGGWTLYSDGVSEWFIEASI